MSLTLAQIAACLFSALAYDELRPAAFSCWRFLLTSMEDEDVDSLLETTFFIIDHFWVSFGESTRREAKALLDTLLEDFEPSMRSSINELPSLTHIKELHSINKRLDNMRAPLDDRQTYSLFTARLSHENSGVVLQALNELASYLRTHQGYLQTSAISDQPDSVIPTLCRTLLDCSAKYNGLQLEITRLCAECIGLVGCLDSNRVEAPREQRNFVLVDNFGNPFEGIDFVIYMLENVLVKAFLSATDSRYVGYMSYAMQELLEKCDVKLAYALQGSGSSQTQAIYRKWLAIPETTKEVLTPFLTSRFSIVPMVVRPMDYPIFNPSKGYANWLRPFVLDLLRRGECDFAQAVFEPLCRVIRVKDVSIAEFLLPYLVVHVVVGEDEAARTKVANELLMILNYEPKEEASFMERDDIKQCYQVRLLLFLHCFPPQLTDFCRPSSVSWTMQQGGYRLPSSSTARLQGIRNNSRDYSKYLTRSIQSYYLDGLLIASNTHWPSSTWSHTFGEWALREHRTNHRGLSRPCKRYMPKSTIQTGSRVSLRVCYMSILTSKSSATGRPGDGKLLRLGTKSAWPRIPRILMFRWICSLA